MMTKRDKVIKLLKIDGSVFYHSWDQVPGVMMKKLNAQELADYMRLHIIPKVSKRLVQSEAYKPETNTRQPRVLGVA